MNEDISLAASVTAGTQTAGGQVGVTLEAWLQAHSLIGEPKG